VSALDGTHAAPRQENLSDTSLILDNADDRCSKSVVTCLTKDSEDRTEQEVMDVADLLIQCKLQTADITVLHNVNVEDILTLARIATYMLVEPKKPIYNEGDTPKGFYFLLSGCVKFFHTGRERHPISTMGKGRAFGEGALLEEKGRHKLVAATDAVPAEIAVIDPFTFNRYIKDTLSREHEAIHSAYIKSVISASKLFDFAEMRPALHKLLRIRTFAVRFLIRIQRQMISKGKEAVLHTEWDRHVAVQVLVCSALCGFQFCFVKLHFVPPFCLNEVFTLFFKDYTT
jgi:CRP-like cAMP-binding protein